MLFGNKIVKIEILDKNGVLAVTAVKNFVFPKNLDSDEDSILIIKGADLREFDKGERVHVITSTKAGDRIKYSGTVTMSIDKQLNVKLSKSNDTQLLEERRRYFKIKVSEKGRVLFVLRDDETIRFDEPEKIEVQDINIGGVFVTCEYLFQQEDVLCLEIDLFPDYKLNVMARVLRVQFDQVGDVRGYGCEFQAVTASQEDYIGKYIYMTQSAERQRSLNEEDDLDG